MLSNCTIAVYATIGLLALCLYKVYFRLAQVVSLPPGPKGLPLVGNLCDMPAEQEWLTFTRWGEKYGTFYFIKCPAFQITQSTLQGIFAPLLFLAKHWLYLTLPKPPATC